MYIRSSVRSTSIFPRSFSDRFCIPLEEGTSESYASIVGLAKLCAVSLVVYGCISALLLKSEQLTVLVQRTSQLATELAPELLLQLAAQFVLWVG